MITCKTHYVCLHLIVAFSAQEWITLTPDEIREFVISCGLDPDDDDPLLIEECPHEWADRVQDDEEIRVVVDDYADLLSDPELERMVG